MNCTHLLERCVRDTVTGEAKILDVVVQCEEEILEELGVVAVIGQLVGDFRVHVLDQHCPG